ncbi:PH domain-containing protein [Rhizohabitans arisaemae]|uniref:PH domain-containing protein n=1 Tax=Rhizohabitans arisaemae TaxID=2720610 RepID=UPI0024B196A6|nr:PH domain-containing protein [Rhizohabitans arisaemae]
MVLPEHQRADGETKVLSFHPHWLRLVGPALTLVATAVAAGAVLYFLPSGFEHVTIVRIAVGVIALLTMFGWSFLPYLRWKTTSYTLTTHRFTINSGILSKSINEIPLAKVQTVRSGQSLIERIFGDGTLIVESAGENGRLELTDIPKVQLVRSELFRLVDEHAEGHPEDRH